LPATLEIRQGDVSAGAIREAWAEILAEVASPESEAHAAVVAQGADSAALAVAPLNIEEREGSIGLTLLIEVGAPVAVYVLKTLWEDFVRPRLRDKLRRDAGPAVE
jgi:hypothetical protein